MLIIFGGLPGTGKTSIARKLARDLKAVYLRIDSIEQAIIRNSREIDGEVCEAGYNVGYAIAEDNLLLGRIVIADSVNPLQVTRNAWIGVAQRARVVAVEVEIICSDAKLHQQRVETRTADIAGHKLPTWQEVVSREYHTWDRKPIRVDTMGRSVPVCVAELRKALRGMNHVTTS